MKVFLSFHFDTENPEYENFVYRVSYYLKKQVSVEPYCFVGDPNDPNWSDEVSKEVGSCDKFVLFMAKDFGQIQRQEAKVFLELHQRDLDRNAICVELPGCTKIPDELTRFIAGGLYKVNGTHDHVETSGGLKIKRVSEAESERCAKEIIERLGERNWVPCEGLPIGYPFDYEKDVIEEFVQGKGQLLSPKRLGEGCPQNWPDVPEIVRPEELQFENPIPEDIIGSYRPREAKIIVDTRTRYHNGKGGHSNCLFQLGLDFPEAGPRERLAYPPSENVLRVGVLVSGGIAPGINAVITGIVERHELYREWYGRKHSEEGYVLEIRGYRDGFAGILSEGGDYALLTKEEVRKWADRGGSMIGTSRYETLLESNDPAKRKERSRALNRFVNKLASDQIDILYIIGGDGSMKTAHAIWTIAQNMSKEKQIDKKISVVAIPKTMDNDILWVWQSFGFLSAVEKAREFIMELHTEVRSNPRLCIMQLFGSDSGFVVSHAALASGVCDLALIPESPFSMNRVSRYIQNRLKRTGQGGRSPYGMILMAETAIPGPDIDACISDGGIELEEKEKIAIGEFIKNHRRVYGQTRDELRTAGLKIISRVLQRDIRNMRPNNEFWKDFRVFTNEPRHLIRAINPSVQDLIYGQRLGILAVDNAMAGYSDFMISQWETEYVLVPLSLVVLGRKRVPRNGIFWKSVLANTGQPDELV